MKKILIYWKNKVGSAVASLCDHLHLVYEMRDDSDEITSFEAYDVIIPSPGVPGTHSIYQTGKVIAELDFAYQFLPRWFQIVSITGTDGKSTTAWIMYQILKQEFTEITITEKPKKVKKSVYLSGNFEIPFSATVLDILKKWEKRGVIVVEISSFMSYAIKKYTSDYTIFTNLKSDHLNWHRDLQEYADAKMNLCRHTSKRSILNQEIFQFASEHNLALASDFSSRIYGIDPTLRDRTDGESIIISGRRRYFLSETHFSWEHNAMNILSCALVANEMKICSKHVKEYLAHIHGLPHRIELIAEKSGIRYIEDSKSTSCQSLIAALGAFPVRTIVLIAGGSDKWDPFDGLEQKLSETVKFAVLIGATREQLAQKCTFARVPYIFAETMSEAVEKAHEKSEKGDTVLLSPGCASFWLFTDYLDRAYQFRDAVELLLGSDYSIKHH